ncbi:hypothetical protein Tco_0751717 [Tanacetum coccineum]|uniref:Zinc finger GRF-type domain-containing protein n=1 Tax=Tanacetum coccineum TaxID=301880 RepID=A0ABQ4Z5Z6_9ASTR
MVRCPSCMAQSIIRTSWTSVNPGRRFYCCPGTHGIIDLDNQSIERDRLIGIGFVLNFVKFISFTFGDKEMISVIEAVSGQILGEFWALWINKFLKGICKRVMALGELRQIIREVFVKLLLDSFGKLSISVSLLLTPLCCDDIHDVTPRVSALAGRDTFYPRRLMTCLIGHACAAARDWAWHMQLRREDPRCPQTL